MGVFHCLKSTVWNVSKNITKIGQNFWTCFFWWRMVWHARGSKRVEVNYSGVLEERWDHFFKLGYTSTPQGKNNISHTLRARLRITSSGSGTSRVVPWGALIAISVSPCQMWACATLQFNYSFQSAFGIGYITSHPTMLQSVCHSHHCHYFQCWLTLKDIADRRINKVRQKDMFTWKHGKFLISSSVT